MAIKNWILHRMNRLNGVVGRSDLAPRGAREPSLRGGAPTLDDAGPDADVLGGYAPLIAAIRDELEHFATSQLRLHLAIAERDRYRLTSIDVEGAEDDDLLRRFTREFTPEQIKRFLARDVIAHLPNASAIDLSQFGGLNAPRAAKQADDGYAELIAQLRAAAPDDAPRRFDVKLAGRWTESDAAPARADATGIASTKTPLAGSRVEIRIEDADGSRHVALGSVVANRRYAIGKGEGCDIAANGAFTSRRHCEIWLDDGRWWVADAGSTNGVRVEGAQGILGRAGGDARGANARAAIEVVPGARIVLSALAQGTPSEYPRVTLVQREAPRAAPTPLNPAKRAATPVTPIAAPLRRAHELTVVAQMASGERSVALGAGATPTRIGRSRNQDLVVDWAHASVSGHHVDVASAGEDGADVEVHGDNGVTVGAVAHPRGQRFRWRVGESMTLGRASGSEPECTLRLERS